MQIRWFLYRNLIMARAAELPKPGSSAAEWVLLETKKGRFETTKSKAPTQVDQVSQVLSPQPGIPSSD